MSSDEDQMRRMGQKERKGIYDLNIRSKQLRSDLSIARFEILYNFWVNFSLLHGEVKLFLKWDFFAAYLDVQSDFLVP